MTHLIVQTVENPRFVDCIDLIITSELCLNKENMAKDYFIGLGIAQIFCGLTTIGTQVHRKDHLNLDLKIKHQNLL